MVDDEPPLLSYTVGRLDRLIRRRLQEILEPYELSIPQFTTLSVLRRRPGLSNAQLARRALILPQSMIQVTTALEGRQLLQREPDPDHNRILQARLTPAGLQLIRRAESDTQSFERAILATLGDGDPERLTTLLGDLSDALTGR